MTLHGQWESSTTEKALTEELVSVATIPAAAMEKLYVQLEVSDHSSLDQFAIQTRCHKNASFETLYDTPDDFTTPNGLLVGTSGDLTTLAANSSGWFIIDVRGIYQVNLQAAQAPGATTTLTIYASGN